MLVFRGVHITKTFSSFSTDFKTVRMVCCFDFLVKFHLGFALPTMSNMVHFSQNMSVPESAPKKIIPWNCGEQLQPPETSNDKDNQIGDIYHVSEFIARMLQKNSETSWYIMNLNESKITNMMITFDTVLHVSCHLFRHKLITDPDRTGIKETWGCNHVHGLILEDSRLEVSQNFKSENETFFPHKNAVTT